MTATGRPIILITSSGVEGHVGIVTDGEDDGIDALEGGAQIIFHLAVLELLLVSEKTRPRMARAGKEKKVIPLQTRQKSRMEATYSRPGMTRS